MTFTDADHAKAVELYRKYRDAGWWPQTLLFLDQGVWANKLPTSKSGKVVTEDIAISAIAWAMVERLGDVDLYHDPDKGYIEYGQGVIGSTRFLALAAAVEALDKGG